MLWTMAEELDNPDAYINVQMGLFILRFMFTIKPFKVTLFSYNMKAVC